MQLIKFIDCDKNQPLNRNNAFTIHDCRHTTINRYDYYLQFIGIHDANKTEVYEGDILELKITPELMDHNKNTFFNSNLGKLIEKEPDITSVILAFQADNRTLCTPYEVYFMRKNSITNQSRLDRDDDNNPVYYGGASDTMFPEYLCQKGAVIVANSITDPEYLQSL